MAQRLKKFEPVIIIHGGAGSGTPKGERAVKIHETLSEILSRSYEVLVKSKSSRKAVIEAVRLLEDCPLFNAGYGSAIQDDGVCRMSSSLMDSRSGSFSGVVNVKGVKNPVLLADVLAKEKNRVLAGVGARRYAVEKNIPLGSPYTTNSKEKLARYLERSSKKYDTVGAVAIDASRVISASTSTGGMTGAMAGRVSDSPTVAGNYANRYAGVSVTGVGEEIVDHAVAAAIVTRVEDGMSLKDAFAKTLRKAKRTGADFGMIGISKNGDWHASKTSEFMSWGVRVGAFKKVTPSLR